jgi:hypothetical protein
VVCWIIGKNGKWGSGPTLARDTMGGNHRRRRAGKLDRKLAALTFRSHGHTPVVDLRLVDRWISAIGKNTRRA